MKSDLFWYTHGPTVWVGSNAKVATLGAKVPDTQSLFGAIAEQLGFPEGPETSWDGLVRRLSELDWPAVCDSGTVVLFHLGLPSFREELLAVYLDSLRRALDGRGDEKPRLVIAFPAAAHARVTTLVRPG